MNIGPFRSLQGLRVLKVGLVQMQGWRVRIIMYKVNVFDNNDEMDCWMIEGLIFGSERQVASFLLSTAASPLAP